MNQDNENIENDQAGSTNDGGDSVEDHLASDEVGGQTEEVNQGPYGDTSPHDADPYGSHVGQETFVAPPPDLAAQQRLVRDPYSSLGGVLSGLAHYYGLEVSLTRLAFVAVLLLSAGFAIPIYFLAWLIIPRASVWPMIPRENKTFSGKS